MAELFIFSGKGDLFSSQEVTGVLSQRSLHPEGQQFLSGSMHRQACSTMKRQNRRTVEATLAVVLLCSQFYIQHLIHKCSERDGIDFFFFTSFYIENT